MCQGVPSLNSQQRIVYADFSFSVEIVVAAVVPLWHRGISVPSDSGSEAAAAIDPDAARPSKMGRPRLCPIDFRKIQAASSSVGVEASAVVAAPQHDRRT